MKDTESKPPQNRRQEIISGPIGPTLFKLTLPMIYALIAVMSLGLVDSYFVAQLGTEQLAAMGFVVPVTFAMTSASLGLGMAISSLTSKLIGAEKSNEAAILITHGEDLVDFRRLQSHRIAKLAVDRFAALERATDVVL